MLCSLCELFTSDIIHQEFGNWKRLNDNWFVFRHGNDARITASAAGGCQLCQLMWDVRRERMPGYEDLGDKWLVQDAMIDVLASGHEYKFQLLTEAPNRSWISFELFWPSEAVRADEGDAGNISGMPLRVSGNCLADSTLSQARRWLEQCRNEHSKCARLANTPLPTRVIDVGYSNDTAFAKLQVNRGQLGEYVTLSHTWGTVDRLTTRKRNLKDFQNALPHQQMPKTFRDAIELTRLLGMRYLWIDALCIVQDDQQDWRQESAAMCAVYENAAFSISALSATDSNSGIFQARDVRQCVVTVGGLTLAVRPKLDTVEEALQKSKLESRAWCMQERILAPAILHIGSEQLYWECRSCTASEAFPRASSLDKGSTLDQSDASYAYIPAKQDREFLLKLWYSLVTRYSARELTKASDRLPAIAGLADKIKRELGGFSSYVYGLWLDDLATGLLWQRPLQRERALILSRDGFDPQVSPAQAGRPRHEVVPSWSWASVLGAVDYSWQREIGSRATSPRDVALSLELGSDPNILQAEGLIKRGTCRLSTSSSSNSGNTGNAGFKPSGSSVAAESISCVLDDTEEVVPKHCYCLWIGTWNLAQSGLSRRKAKATGRVFYLLLERSQGSSDDSSPRSRQHPNNLGRFKRIGMGYDAAEKVGKVFMNAERHALELAQPRTSPMNEQL